MSPRIFGLGRFEKMPITLRLISPFVITAIISFFWINVGESRANAEKLNQIELLEFMEKVVHAQAVDDACDVFDRDRKAQLYLAYRWGQSQAMDGSHPPQLMLTIIQAKAQYHADTENVNCGAPEVVRVSDSLEQFVDSTSDTVNFDDIQ